MANEPKIKRSFSRVKDAEKLQILAGQIENFEREEYGHHLNLLRLEELPEGVRGDADQYEAALKASEDSIAQLASGIKVSKAEHDAVKAKLEGDKGGARRARRKATEGAGDGGS